jgi:hypothetical protein
MTPRAQKALDHPDDQKLRARLTTAEADWVKAQRGGGRKKKEAKADDEAPTPAPTPAPAPAPPAPKQKKGKGSPRR